MQGTSLNGGILRIGNAKVVGTQPKYSTSRLPYYLRVVHPLGIKTLKTIIEAFAATGRWAAIPNHHPFVDIASMQRVQSDLQVCVLGIVTSQPGAVARDSRFGVQEVCNAVLQQKQSTIR